MALLTIPISDAATLGNFYQTVTLEGRDYQLDFVWNTRESFWYMSIKDEEGNHIRSGLKAVCNFPVTRLWKDAERPPGQFIFLDTRDIPVDPDLDELGVEIPLTYEESDTVP